MFLVDKIILLGAVLILIGVISSKLSSRLGLPVLVLFLFVGMLAGEGGVGRIAFDNPEAAHALGTLALAIILFDGGLQTSAESIRTVWKPAALLATIGVLVTAAVTGMAAFYILKIPLLEGLLIGAIVASTDAAAVFSLFRSSGIHIKKRLRSTLEIESASNDPMAIFLTIGLLEILMNDMPVGVELLKLFLMQMGVAAVIGISVGWLAVRVINKVNFVAIGLYPVTVAACGLFAFGLAANLGGSGFLAIFLAGVFIGNSRFVFQRSTFLFHDGLAWLSQITMFVVLGLLVNPADVLEVWVEGLLISFVLMFVARPLIVMPILSIFNFDLRQIVLVSWVGLRGSVPIILAIFPLMFGLPNAPLIFNVVFFVVLISAIIQGSTLSFVARKLGLSENPPATPAATLEIISLRDVDADIIEYIIGEQSRTAGQSLARLALPDSTVVAMINRGNFVLPPRGSTKIEVGDHLFVVLRPEVRAFVDLIFSNDMEVSPDGLPNQEVALKGATTLDDIHRSYGIRLQGSPQSTLEDLFHEGRNEPNLNARLLLHNVTLIVRSIVGKRIATIGLVQELVSDDVMDIISDALPEKHL